MTVTFNALLESAGGTFVNDASKGADATISLAQQPTVVALAALKKLAASSAADPELNTANEDSSRGRVREGRVAVRDQLPVHLSERRGGEGPAGRRSAGRASREVIAGKPSKPPLGGFNIGIASHSKHQDLDVAATECIVQPGQPAGRRREGRQPADAVERSTTRSTRSSTRSRTLLRESINDAAPRPVTPAYNDLSLAVQDTLVPLQVDQPAEDGRQAARPGQAGPEVGGGPVTTTCRRPRPATTPSPAAIAASRSSPTATRPSAGSGCDWSRRPSSSCWR